ncbi:polypyrimidine tract-binding protein 2-like isoform X3, partial [Biomphalaria pfeifferi]
MFAVYSEPVPEYMCLAPPPGLSHALPSPVPAPAQLLSQPAYPPVVNSATTYVYTIK